MLLASSTTASANAASEHSIRIMGKAKKAQKAPKRARRGRKDSSKQTKAKETKAEETKDEKEVELFFPFPMDIVERILCKFQDMDARLLGKGVLLLYVLYVAACLCLAVCFLVCFFSRSAVSTLPAGSMVCKQLSEAVTNSWQRVRVNTLQQLRDLLPWVTRRRRSVANFHLRHVVFEGMKVEEQIPGPTSLQAKCNRRTVYEVLLVMLVHHIELHKHAMPLQVDFVRCEFGPSVSLYPLALECITVSFIHCRICRIPNPDNPNCGWPLRLVRAPALGAACLFTELTSSSASKHCVRSMPCKTCLATGYKTGKLR